MAYRYRPYHSKFNGKIKWHQALRKRVFERDSFACQHCGREGVPPENYTGRYGVWPLVLDHIIPASKGGTLSDENCQCLCEACNGKKFNK